MDRKKERREFLPRQKKEGRRRRGELHLRLYLSLRGGRGKKEEKGTKSSEKKRTKTKRRSNLTRGRRKGTLLE